MKYFIGGIALACALLAQQAQAVPIHYHFNGTVQQTVFDPDNPFSFPVGPGAQIVGRVNLDTVATDQAPGDPNVGAYTFTQGPGAPYFMELELHQGGGTWGFFFNTFTVGIVNGPAMDQYTIHGLYGDPTNLGEYAMFEMRFDYAPGTFDSDAFLVMPPAVFSGISSSFMLTGAMERGGELYQYELMGTPRSALIPEPGTLALVLIGAGAFAARQRRRVATTIPLQY